MAVAKDTYIALGTNGAPGTPTNRLTKFDDLKMPRQLDAVEITTFGNNGNRTYDPGLKGATFSGSGIWDATIDAHLEAIYNAADVVAFEYCPIANTSGNVKYAGSCFVTKYEIGAKVGDKIPFSFEAQITSGITRSVVA